MAKGFTCHICGNGTLVRSNMRFTPGGLAYCRASRKCLERGMSGLYNLLQGYNPAAITIMAVLKLDHTKVDRFRDAWFTDDGKRMILLTREGGRQCGESYRYLTIHPQYVSDHNDNLDSTYAHFIFTVPEELEPFTVPLADAMKRLGLGEDKNGPKAMLAKLTEQKGAISDRVDPKIAMECIALHRALTERVFSENEAQPA